MKRIFFPLVAFAAFAAFAATSAAHDAPAAISQARQEAHLEYPAPAPAFRKLVDERIEGARVRLEQYITTKAVPREKAQALRERFRAAIAQINAKVTEACADGTVTAEEARGVHELAKELRAEAHEAGEKG
jgi:hypothetical protein